MFYFAAVNLPATMMKVSAELICCVDIEYILRLFRLSSGSRGKICLQQVLCDFHELAKN